MASLNPLPVIQHLATNPRAMMAVTVPAALATYCLTHAEPQLLEFYGQGVVNLDYWVCLQALFIVASFFVYSRAEKFFFKQFLRMPGKVHGRRQVRWAITLTFFAMYVQIIRPSFQGTGFSLGVSSFQDWTACWVSPFTEMLPYADLINTIFAGFFKTLFGGVVYYYCCVVTNFAVELFGRLVNLINWETCMPGWLYIDTCDYFTGFVGICYRHLGWVLMHYALPLAFPSWTSTEFDYWLIRGCLTVALAAPMIPKSFRTRARSSSGRKRSSSGNKAPAPVVDATVPEPESEKQHEE